MAKDFENLLKEFEIKKQKIEDLKLELKDLNGKRDLLKKELPALDEELQLWGEEIENLGKKEGMDEELAIWNEEIGKIKINKKEKANELEEIEVEVHDKIKEEAQIKLESKTDFNNLKVEIIKELKEINSKKSENNSKKLFYLIKVLKDTLDEIYTTKTDPICFLKILKDNNVELNDSYLKIINDLFEETKVTILPDFISSFVIDCIKDLNPENILSPWANNGFIMGSILKKLKNIKATCYVNNEMERNIFDTIYDDLTINWKYPKDIQDDDLFDVIFGVPPIDPRKGSIKLKFHDETLELSDKNSFIKFLKGTLKLKSSGLGFFILESDFLYSRDNNSVFSNLKKLNIFIDAVMDIPPEYFDNKSDKILVVVKRIENSNLFIGRLSRDERSNNVMTENYKKRDTGKLPQFGALTTIESFYSFKSFTLNYENNEIGTSLGLKTVPFSKIVKEINISDETDEFENAHNSVYLNISSISEVLTSLERVKKSENSFIQLVFDSKKVYAKYIAHFLNTDMGRRIKELLYLNEDDPTILKKILFNIEIYLPDLDKQIEIVRINSMINDISVRAEGYKQELWKTPNQAIEILKKVNGLDKESEYRFEMWIESLPFPVASILWESITASDYEHKVKYLLHFFEAFSEMNVVLMLSALISDKSFFDSEFSWCTRANPKFKSWYLNPTFGNWNFFGRCLAKNIRKLLRNRYNLHKCLELFGNPEKEFLERITSEELYEILDEVSRYRNSWEGHGPIVTPKEYENRSKILRTALSNLYQVISNIYENTLFVLPIESSYKDGIYYYTVKKFMGSRSSFKTLKLETTLPMDTEKIYLISNNQRSPLELIDLIIFDEKACYYYNEFDREKNKTQFISYHYKENPEIFFPFEKLNRFRSLFSSIEFY